MLSVDAINNGYFDWIYTSVTKDRFSKSISYKKLLMHLHNTEFRYYIPGDAARYSDGLNLRYIFAYKNPEFKDAERYIDGPCSVLEMIFALAIDCEETIMDNTNYGDRTADWFWHMICNMGLGGMYDKKYDREYVDSVLERFMKREYEPNGKGGLFTVNDADQDLRNVEIWWQLCWYIDSIT